MTGKTHMAISAATVAVILSATGCRASKGIPYLLAPDMEPSRTPDPGLYSSGAFAIAGLLLLGVVAGLFPDLDSPDTELQHLPHRAADRLGRYLRMGTPRRSLLPTVVQQILSVAALPFAAALAAISAGLRVFTGHRGFTHTLCGALAFTALVVGSVLLLTGDPRRALVVGVVWVAGYASHLAADACTPSGIPLFGGHLPSLVAPWWRMTQARTDRSTDMLHSRSAPFHLLPKGMRIRTGALVDTLLIRWTGWAVCMVAAVPMFIAS